MARLLFVQLCVQLLIEYDGWHKNFVGLHADRVLGCSVASKVKRLREENRNKPRSKAGLLKQHSSFELLVRVQSYIRIDVVSK